jgi:ParB-like chromosome segregation protein Spo0J
MMKIRISHEYASLIPELSTQEYESLKQSIKQNGLWVPIVVNKDGVILDGHHRYKVCQELGIEEPKTETKEFKDKLEEQIFVIDSNLQRRHLNNFQRTELALKSKSILDQIVKRNESLGGKGDRILTPVGRVDEQIGQRAGVSRDTVRRVLEIQEKASEELKQDLRTDKVSINQAIEMIHRQERDDEFDDDKVCKDFQILIDKFNKAVQESDKVFTEFSQKRPQKPKPTTTKEREARIEEILEQGRKCLVKEFDADKAIAAMKFFLEYFQRYYKNYDSVEQATEYTTEQTLKYIIERDTDKELGIPWYTSQVFEKILCHAVAENKIDNSAAKIKNMKTVQAQLQVLRQREEREEDYDDENE